MRTASIAGAVAVALASAAHTVSAETIPPRSYNVVWDTPSENAVGSMPLAGGNLGLNVWVEGDDLLFYIGHPDSRVEDERLVKLGRVRISFGSARFRKQFRQELDLAESCIRITGDGIEIMLWIDAFAPVVHVGMASREPVDVQVAYESWRFTAAPVEAGLEWVYRLDPAQDQRLARIRRQKAEPLADQVPDLLRNFTLGGRLLAPGLVPDGAGEGVYMKTPFQAWRMKSPAPVSRLDLRVLLRVAQDDSVAAWRGELDRLAQRPSDRQQTVAWWRDFWARSWIVINPGASDEDPAWQAGRNYQLFRYLLAANRTGQAPTLFNGGLFTFDNPLPNANAFGAGGPNPDCRAWWGCHFMAQNQRLIYWPMLRAGDFDLLDVGLDFYRDREPVARAKARHFLGVDGTLFTESIDLFGLIAASQSGNGLEAARHLSHHFTSGLEFAFMMLEACRYQGRGVEASLPVMMGMLEFYDSYYQKACHDRTGEPLDAGGKLVIYPGNAAEMGVGCRNHADALAGLWALTDGLLQLPGTDRAWLTSFRGRLPPIHTTEQDGRRIIPMAESWEAVSNPNEFPQMYAVFPFRRYGVGLPDLEVARDTWRYAAIQPQNQQEVQCWKYDNIAVAGLGLLPEAPDYCLRKLLYPFGKNGGREREGATANHGNCAQFAARYPAFYVPYPFDHFPCMDHGGSAMIGLQEMLLQTPPPTLGRSGEAGGDRLLLLPAWPRDWDVHFKLHAPQNTTVEGEVRGGQLVRLDVLPAARRRDVEIIGPLTPPPPPPRPVSQGKAARASSVYHAPGYDPGKAFDGDLSTRWSMDNGQGSGWLEVDLGQAMTVRRIVIQERSYPQTTRFSVEALQPDGTWLEVAAGGGIGARKELGVSTTAQKFRLHIHDSKLINAGAGATIDEFQLYE